MAAARERLEVVDNRLTLKTARMENYDKAIVKSEAAYLQILESSQVTKRKEQLGTLIWNTFLESWLPYIPHIRCFYRWSRRKRKNSRRIPRRNSVFDDTLQKIIL